MGEFTAPTPAPECWAACWGFQLREPPRWSGRFRGRAGPWQVGRKEGRGPRGAQSRHCSSRLCPGGDFIQDLSSSSLSVSTSGPQDYNSHSPQSSRPCGHFPAHHLPLLTDSRATMRILINFIIYVSSSLPRVSLGAKKGKQGALDRMAVATESSAVILKLEVFI